jgi:hypothetical protein
MPWLRRHYGAGPFHLLALLACFAVAAYAVTQVLSEGGWKAILLWFAACVVAHDLVGWPLYALADRLLVRAGARRPGRAARRVPWINHLRIPVVVSSVLFVISFPLIFRLSNGNYEDATGFSEGVYLTNWLVVTGVLFAASMVIYGFRLVWLRRRRIE